ncbi:hypothetical protein AAVH_38362 [Aphelenchoides avenae]|nr:hypothetical protein AAVH_38362 [Aphelenchus avenae]
MLKSFKAGREELWKANLADPYDWEKDEKKPVEAKQANPYDAHHDTVADPKETKPERKAATKSAQRPVRPNK